MPAPQQATSQAQSQTPDSTQRSQGTLSVQTAPKTLNIKPPPDIREKDERNLYSTPYHSIIFRNFLAGAARALGGIILYIIFLVIMGWIASAYVLPQLKPFLSVFESLGNLQSGSTAGQPYVNPDQLNQLIQQLNSPPPTQ